MKTRIKISLITIAISFILISCRQERFLFYPDVLPHNHRFPFTANFQEMFFKVDKEISLNGLLFPSSTSKGLIFYLHGNGGSIDSWRSIANLYVRNNYDFFIIDYRGYGKSQGKIYSEKQFYNDLKVVYDSLKKRYDENKTIIIGYSIGTGPAAKLASISKPKMLILKAPYYNLPFLAHQYIKNLPSFLIRYKFPTNKFVKQVRCPVVIFHGDQDEVININSSFKLKQLFKENDRFIILPGQRHNGINDNPLYQQTLEQLLK